MEDDPTNDDSAADDATAATETDPAELQKQRDDYYDRLLRKTAEFDNYRKRTERERHAAVGSGGGGSARGAAAARRRPGARAEGRRRRRGRPRRIRSGVELIHKQLLEILRKRGVEPIEALGADFDPHYHKAVVARAGRRPARR